jgi:hypothetical protein
VRLMRIASLGELGRSKDIDLSAEAFPSASCFDDIVSSSAFNVDGSDCRLVCRSSATRASVSREPVGDTLPRGCVELLDDRVCLIGNGALSRSRGCDFVARSTAMLSASMLFIGWIVLDTVDMDENRECDVDCKDEVKEDRLLLLSENLWCGDLGVSTCESS